MASGVIAYQSALSSQHHAAYTDYFFEMQAKNETLQKTGLPQETILPKEKWLDDYYRPRLAYADYYATYTENKRSTNSLIPYEIWKETAYKQMLQARTKTTLRADPRRR